jgi:hypothetical protein
MIKTLLIIILLSGCASNPDDDIFKTGKEVKHPHGCQELRSRGGEC